ncbi:MAG: flagellar M-ring protein FliF C-terminal domain-containing protein [Myxococcota bacterium]
MTDFLTRARLFYGNLEPARQTQLWAGLAAVIITVIGLSWWMSTEPYAAIYSGDVAELSELAAALTDEGIATRTDGVSLFVPEARRGEAMGLIRRIDPMPDIEDGNSMNPGTSSKTQAWAQGRQKEGELARAISKMPGIRGARVLISPGKEPLYSNESGEPARASVFLRVSANSMIGSQQASAIQSLVAGSVERMRPENVGITDSKGTLIASGQGAGSKDARLGSELFELHRSYAGEIQSNISQAVGRLMSFEDGFVVSANVELDRESVVEQARDYDVDKAFESETSLQEKKREKTKGVEGGAPGVDAELPERAADAGGNDMNKEESTNSKSKITAPVTDRRTVKPAGKLLRASATLTVNETALAAAWDMEPGAEGWQERLDRIEGVAKTAMGFDEARGDSFTMIALPFAPIEVAEAPTVTMDGAVGMIAPFVPYAIAFVALLLAFFFVVRPLMAQVAKSPLPKSGEVAMEIGPDGQPRAIASNREDDDLARRMHELVENFQPVDSEDLNKLIHQQSDASAKVVRDWMKQGA